MGASSCPIRITQQQARSILNICSGAREIANPPLHDGRVPKAQPRRVMAAARSLERRGRGASSSLCYARGKMSLPVADRADEDQALILAIHEDRLAAKAKEKREGWTRYVSLMVVVLAVATAIGALKAGGFSSRVMLNQAQASD